MQTEQKKEHAQHIFSLGCPDHGLDVYGMKRKQGGDEQAAPGESRGTLQQQEKKHGVGRMQQDVDFMMGGWVQTEQLAIQSMGKPGQRMVVSGVIGCECPLHRRPSEARSDMWVVGEVRVVVVVEKPVVSYGAVTDEHDGNQKQGKKDCVVLGASHTGEWGA